MLDLTHTTMQKGLKILLTIWLIILSIISIVTLIRTFYSKVELDVDYMGIIVGILAALCTVLIGWQIYSIIDISKIMQKFEGKVVKLTEESDKQIERVNKKLEEEKRLAKLNTAFQGYLLLLVIGKKKEKIVIEAFNRINQIDESTDLIREMSYQALKGCLPQLLQSQEDFYLRLKQFYPCHFDRVCKMALDEYSLTQNQSDFQILELVKKLKHQCYPS